MSTERSSVDVREQVRQHALELFLRHGYAGASLRDIAAAVGVTPAALYYHYRIKDALLDDLLGPLLARIDDLVTNLEREQAAGEATCQAVLSRLLDAVLAHRDAFRFASGDIAVQNHPITGARIAALNSRLARLLGGTDDPADRVLVSAALGVLFRPVTRQPDDPIDQFRGRLVEAAVCVLDSVSGPRDSQIPA